MSEKVAFADIMVQGRQNKSSVCSVLFMCGVIYWGRGNSAFANCYGGVIILGVKENADRLQSSSGDWTGNLFDFFFRVNSMFANCLVNADFYVPRGVVIKKEQDSIVMENPGYVRTGKRQMLKGGISDPRNKALMKMFNLIGIGERAGSGVPDIFAVWEQEGWKEPEIEEQYGPDRTTLTLSLIKKSAIKISDKKSAIKTGNKRNYTKKSKERLEKIIFFMEEGKEYTAVEIAEEICLKPARTRELLRILADEGMVELLGGNKDRKYKKCQDYGTE